MRPTELRTLIRQGAIFYVSHSGGKDSQAMYARIRRRVPHERIVVVHADLGEIEWHGVQDHIRTTIAHELNVVRAKKTFFDMVRHRAATRPDVPSFPDAGRRQCTSDLKRGPIQKFIRRDMNARGATLGVNCMGLRAEESASRRRLPAWSVNKALSTNTRTVYDWLPIHTADHRAGLPRDPQGRAAAVPRVRGRQPPALLRVLHLRVPRRHRQRPPRAARAVPGVHETWSARPAGRCSPAQSLAQRCDAGDAEREAEKNPAQGRLCW